jgi:hypothetical protein
MYIAPASENFDYEYIDKHYFMLLLDSNKHYIVADIMCSAGAMDYSTWVFLRQQDYELFRSNKEEFNKWIDGIRSKGRKGDSDYLIRYNPETKESYLYGRPEQIANVDTTIFKPKT